MPMVPGLTTNMPSKTSFYDDPATFFEDSYVPPDLDFDFLHALSTNDIFSQLDVLPEDEIFNAGSLLPAHEVKRDCLFGKPPDLCLRECGQDCDPFRYYEVRRCGCGSNMPIAHCCENYKMVSPQSVLPIQLPVHSIYNDHSYYQTIGYPDSGLKQTYSYESESQSDSADEIVDVETVQEKAEQEPPETKVIKKRGRKPAQKLKPQSSKPAAINRRTIAKKKNKNMPVGRPARRPKWGKASREPSSASSSDAEEFGKRINHNDLERKRRNHQKSMLHELRVMIPSIKHNTKAPKVMILNEAAKYCSNLTAQRIQYKKLKRSVAEKNKELERRFNRLQRQLKLQ